MHGNAGNQLEGLKYADAILQNGLSLCVFDFSGCGNSEGEFVTLGHKEVDDLNAIIQKVMEAYKPCGIGLWGRSMGATTALIH